MPLYEVLREARLEAMIVRAKDEVEATRLAVVGTIAEVPAAHGVNTRVLSATPAVRVDVAKGDRRSEARTCEWCYHTAHRAEWGPGWVRCPSCQTCVPTAALARALATPQEG